MSSEPTDPFAPKPLQPPRPLGPDIKPGQTPREAVDEFLQNASDSERNAYLKRIYSDAVRGLAGEFDSPKRARRFASEVLGLRARIGGTDGTAEWAARQIIEAVDKGNGWRKITGHLARELRLGRR